MLNCCYLKKKIFFNPSHIAGHLSAKTWTASNIIPGNVSPATEDFWVMMHQAKPVLW